MSYWLMKSEPFKFSIDDLAQAKNQQTPWDGVRNYQVRNWLRDEIHKGDHAFFYHSSCDVPAIVGIVKVVKAGYPDPSAFDKNSPYYDSKTDLEHPRWYCVDVQLVKKFVEPIALQQLKKHKELQNMRLLQKGSRLSIVPVTEKEWQLICALSGVLT